MAIEKFLIDIIHHLNDYLIIVIQHLLKKKTNIIDVTKYINQLFLKCFLIIKNSSLKFAINLFCLFKIYILVINKINIIITWLYINIFQGIFKI